MLTPSSDVNPEIAYQSQSKLNENQLKSPGFKHWLTQKFELSRGGGHHQQPMEGVRGFAVFLVFLVHYVTLSESWIHTSPNFHLLTTSLHTIGNAGVDLFFVLSGYLIYGSLLKRHQPFTKFLSRRVQRIYPAFLTVFMIYLVLSFAFPAENKIPGQPLSALIYLLQNLLLLPGLFPIEPMITVAWSLSYEMFYYLAIPGVIAVFRLRKWSAMWRTTFFLGVALLTALYCAVFGGHIRLIMFISGIMLYEALSHPYISRPSSSIGFLALILGLSGMLIPLEGSAGYALKISILFVTFFIFCLSCFSRPTAWLARGFSWTPLRWLGNMSYSYYLLHGLTLKAGFLVLSTLLPQRGYGPEFFWMFLPPMFFASLFTAALLFLSIERPFSLAPSKTKGNRPLTGTPETVH